MQDSHPTLSLVGGKTTAVAAGTSVAFLASQLKLPPLLKWGTVALAGAFTVKQLWNLGSLILGKRFIITQDKVTAPERIQADIAELHFVKKIQATLKDLYLFVQLERETKCSFLLYGNATKEEKRNVIRALAAPLSIPVFFVSKEDLENSPHNLLETLVNINNKANKARFAYGTFCSFICFEDLEQLKEQEDFRHFINFIRFNSGLTQNIIFGISDEDVIDQRFDDKNFSFKLEATQLEDSSVKICAHNSPSFKPYSGKEEKESLPCYESTRLTLDRLPGGYPKEITLLVDKIKNGRKRKSNGLLFCGPPGTGKTMTARALAGTLNVPFFNVPMSYIFSGEENPGERVTTIFRNAYKKATEDNTTAIVFFDECDMLLKPLEEITIENEKLAANALRNALSGFSEEGQNRIIFIAATNRKTFDEALTRNERIGTQLYFGLPNEERRREILEYYLR